VTLRQNPKPAVSLEERRRLLAQKLQGGAQGQDRFPLSFAQQRLWMVHQMAPASAAYNMPYVLRLRGALDTEVLGRAFSTIVQRHATLRTVFPAEGGVPVQRILPPRPVDFRVVDLRPLAPAERDAEAARLAAAEASLPFDLAAGPLLRGALLRLADDEHVLLLTLHHIVCDGWSLGVLTREVSALYDAYSRGAASPLPALPVQYVDFAVWQRGWLAGGTLDVEVAWWRERLRGAPPLLEIATDRPRAAQPGEAGGRVPVTVPVETAEALRGLSRAAGTTLFITLLAAWQLLLSRYSGQTDVSVGTPTAGRNRLETEGLIGFFVNTLVLRTDLSGNPGFRTLLERVRAATLDAYGHQDVPFERLVEELEPERSVAHSPLFQTVFTLQSDHGEDLRLGSLRAEPLDAGVAPAKYDLSLTLAEPADGTIRGSLAYRAELFDTATVERMREHLLVLLAGVAAEPDRPIADVPLLADAERRLGVEAWNDTAAEYPAGTVHASFEAQAERTPDAVAVAVRGGESVTYRALNERANRLAHRLVRLGVGPDVQVGLCAGRSAELVVGMLAILKAGGAYVPLDTAYPADRLAFMAADSGIRIVLIHGAEVPLEGLTVIALGEDTSAEPIENPARGVDSANLTYVIYTSGSTGRPKAVGVPHGALANHMAWMQDAYPLTANDRVLQKTPLSFDASVWEFYAPLLIGATLVMAGREAHRDPAELLRTLAEEEITILQVVPAYLRAVLETSGTADVRSLRTLFCGGEALAAELAARAADAFGCTVVNLYGPTETCIDATSHVFSADGAGAQVPIGRPVANTGAYVLDAVLAPVPIGIPGELYIGGAQVTRGYLGRPGLTAERFVPDPFGGEPGARMYRTGDKLRWKADGTLEFMGRLDGQVKIRGFRIEPGEIESVLSAHPELAETRVVVREDTPGEHRLVAYVVGTAGTDVLPVYLRQSLPEYMVPAAFVVMEQLPLTPNGKLDVRALPAPEMGSREELYVAPRTPIEEALAGIWAEVLGVERVGIHEGFFALGGHSLLAMRVVSRVHETYGVELPVAALFRHTTIAGLAPELETLAAQGGTNPPSMAADDDEAVRAAVDEMSEEELDRLLDPDRVADEAR
jgi:amino acid adenylation domain-containing protein